MARAKYKKDVIDIPRGKLVGQNGPGSLYVNTEGISYTISAVDKWYSSAEKIDKSHFEVHDSRLEKLLNVSHFREVPVYRNPYEVDNKVNSGITIPISRFPLAHYCTSCGYLSSAKPGDTGKNFYCSHCKSRKEFAQFPIIIACQHGHMDDFPYFEYVHRNQKIDSSIKHEVTVDWSGKSSILNWALKCSCGARHSLKGITGQSRASDGKTPFQREMNNIICTGKKPWLGNEIDEECEFKPEALLRNSLRVYETEVVSALSLSDSKQTDSYSDFNTILSDEYDILSGKEKEKDPDKLTVENSFHENENSVIKKVNYVRRLQEIIVQTGFGRLSPVGEEEILENISKDSSMLFSDGYHNWFPAKQLYGEGIFIEFNKELLNKWAGQKNVENRFTKMQNRIDNNYESNLFTSPIHVLIHTLSHSLISELSNESGYSMTATKEKLYLLDDKYGLLIYVTDTDKDGTFGGLVRLAEEENFKKILNQALLNLDWCSSDPVCSEIGENYGQGLGNTNGSACHNCTFVPNTSCPHRNCYLDRDFVGRSDAPTCITYAGQFKWFNEENNKNTSIEIEVLQKGIPFPYKSWSEASAFEPSNYYLENNWAIPSHTDGVIKINEKNYETKYYNEKTKQVVFYNNQRIPMKELEKNEEWEFIIEK